VLDPKTFRASLLIGQNTYCSKISYSGAALAEQTLLSRSSSIALSKSLYLQRTIFIMGVAKKTRKFGQVPLISSPYQTLVDS
jgi:hypothetical protein